MSENQNRASTRVIASDLSLAVKLYAIFGLFALLTAAITLLSNYNARRAVELTESIQTANLAALNVERVNSLVYAVVMESRGVYMSTEKEAAKKFGDRLLKFNTQILDVVNGWKLIVQADDTDQFATFKKRIEQFVDFRKELVRRAMEINPAAGREWGDNEANRSVRTALNKDLEALSKVYADRGKAIALQTETNRQLSLVLTGLGGVALALVIIGVILIARSIARPLAQITATIKAVAEGGENVEVPHTCRGDEIGALARAIQIFQQAMDHNRSLNSQVADEFKVSRGTGPAHRDIGRRFQADDRNRRPCGQRQCVRHARQRTIHRAGVVGGERSRQCRSGGDHTGLRQRIRRRQRHRGAIGLRGRDRQAGPPVRQRRRTYGATGREVDHRNRKPRRSDAAN